MAVVTFEAIEASFRAAFVAYWAARTPIALENSSFDPEAQFSVNPSTPAASNLDAWVRISVDYIGDGVVNQSINPFGTYQRTALAFFEIFVRQGSGVSGVNAYADAVVRFLRMPGLFPDAIISGVLPAPVGPNGVWFQRNVTANLAWFSEQAAA